MGKLLDCWLGMRATGLLSSGPFFYGCSQSDKKAAAVAVMPAHKTPMHMASISISVLVLVGNAVHYAVAAAWENLIYGVAHVNTSMWVMSSHYCD
jgi:hypothetical protein